MVILKSAMRQSSHRLEKPQISHTMAKQQLEEVQRMNQGVNLIRARITNKDVKHVPTGDLFIITLDIEGSDALPSDWSTFNEALYRRVNVGETWQVHVSTKPKAENPNEFHRNINEFVEIVEQSDRPQPTHYWDGEKNVRIEEYVPEEDEAQYPPDESNETWLEMRAKNTSVNSISIEMQVALKAATDVYLGRLNEPQLYNPENIVSDVLNAAKRFQVEYFGHPRGEEV